MPGKLYSHMGAAPNATSHGLTTALTGGLTKVGWVFVGISAAKPETAAQVRASAAAHAIFFIAFHSPGAICLFGASAFDLVTIEPSATAALPARTRDLLINLAPFVRASRSTSSRISGGSEDMMDGMVSTVPLRPRPRMIPY